jgi:hypothetical protein
MTTDGVIGFAPQARKVVALKHWCSCNLLGVVSGAYSSVKREATRLRECQPPSYRYPCSDSHFQKAGGASTRMPRKGSRVNRS